MEARGAGIPFKTGLIWSGVRLKSTFRSWISSDVEIDIVKYLVLNLKGVGAA